jgi:N-acyl-D-amino-acid deacylase
LIPDWALEGGRAEFKKRLEDPTQKARMVEGMREMRTRIGHKDYAYAVIASFGDDPSLNGLNVKEAALRVRGSDSLEDQMELVLDIQRRGGASGVFHGMNESDMQTIMRHPNTMVACDSSIREFGKGVPHPRGYGNAARVLGRYVRELNVLRMEDAVRKITSYPASTFRLKDRSVVREGAWADLVVFNPRTVRDMATFTEPHQYPEGIPHVLVNGVFVVQDGKVTGARPGRVLRHLAVAGGSPGNLSGPGPGH